MFASCQKQTPASIGLLGQNDAQAFVLTDTGDLLRSDHPQSLKAVARSAATDALSVIDTTSRLKVAIYQAKREDHKYADHQAQNNDSSHFHDALPCFKQVTIAAVRAL